ncbi:MAG: SDR family oxidoreductase [Bacteroidales bacterium]|nr:SDR family oxidoreductase [Bacteroidales bacterium]
MKILLTGATGYIGQRLLPGLISNGHTIVCCVRDKLRFDASKYGSSKIEVVEVDFLKEETLDNIPKDIDAAYYLIHSMSSPTGDFQEMEARTAENFRNRVQQTNLKQVIYLSGIINESELSKHLASRKKVEEILASGKYHLTTLRAGIIIGEGSASFEIIRDLVEKLPLMVAPRWLKTKSQPIAISNVTEFLQGVLMKEETFDQSYDIGGPEVLTYSEMMQKFAKVRQLRRIIIPVPVMTPKLSSYWLYFVTSTSYTLAVNLVNSMKVEVIARENNLHKTLGIEVITYEEAVRHAFDHIANQDVFSGLSDAPSGKVLNEGSSKLVEVPAFGCYKDTREIVLQDEEKALDKIWDTGGKRVLYYPNRLRARSGSAGHSPDFWRVIYSSRAEKRLLLYSEMKLPGEAWLEFKIKDNTLHQIVTFRPHGLWGRVYWNSLMPFHRIIFKNMIKKIAQ